MEKYVCKDEVIRRFNIAYKVNLLDVERYLMDAKIDVSEDSIRYFLQSEAKKDGVDLNAGIKNGNGWLNDIKLKNRYKFNEIDFKFLRECFNIYRQKTIKLVVIARLMAKPISEISDDNKNLLEKLDIEIVGDKIKESDLERVFVPLYENYQKLKRTERIINDYNTYLSKILDADSMFAMGITMWDCVPSNSLQDFSQVSHNKKEFIPLTEKQKIAHQEKSKDK